jgi:hypothetical protein
MLSLLSQYKVDTIYSYNFAYSKDAYQHGGKSNVGLKW